MDAIDQLYAISEKFNDDLVCVCLALRIAGTRKRPSQIMSDLEWLRVAKYAPQLSSILALSQADFDALGDRVRSALIQADGKYTEASAIIDRRIKWQIEKEAGHRNSQAQPTLKQH